MLLYVAEENPSKRLDRLSSHPQMLQEINVLTVAATQKHDMHRKAKNKKHGENKRVTACDSHILAKQTIWSLTKSPLKAAPCDSLLVNLIPHRLIEVQKINIDVLYNSTVPIDGFLFWIADDSCDG